MAGPDRTVLIRRGASLLAVLVAAVVLSRGGLIESSPSGPGVTAERGGDQAVAELYESRRSGVMVEVAGVVDRVLSDDREGSRHQRFIVRLTNGRTLLVAHNIDLAPRVPLGEGDRIGVYGEYEWNEQGGVLHWTHHDPEGRRPGGWVEFDGEQYR